MHKIRETDALLLDQCARYPHLDVQDLVKALYQCEFGCGHLVSASGDGCKWLLDEARTCMLAHREAQLPFVEPLGDAYVRVHLTGLAESGLCPDTLFALFALSGRERSGETDSFLRRLARLEALIGDGTLPLRASDAQRFLAAYRASGCPATHHSQTFRDAYAPAYRVIRAAYARFLPIFCAIDRLLGQKDKVCVAIEGGSASGKTSLAALLQAVYACNVYHMDDYFLQAHQRVPERYSEPGGNVDYERFADEVLSGIARGTAFDYRPFDCAGMSIGAPVHALPNRLHVVEGAYSMHPTLASAYDLSVFLSIDAKTQAQRILARNGEAMLSRFLHEWIPLETLYFDSTGTALRCDICLPLTGEGEQCHESR